MLRKKLIQFTGNHRVVYVDISCGFSSSQEIVLMISMGSNAGYRELLMSGIVEVHTKFSNVGKMRRAISLLKCKDI